MPDPQKRWALRGRIRQGANAPALRPTPRDADKEVSGNCRSVQPSFDLEAEITLTKEI